MQKDFVDCIVLSYKQKSYLFPAIAIAEVILSHDEYHQKIEGSGQLVFLTWRDLVLPLVPLDLKPLKEVLTQTKIVIIHSLDVRKKSPSYIATLSEERPQRMRIYLNDLFWFDSHKKIARMKNVQHKEEFVLFDLAKFSNYTLKD